MIDKRPTPSPTFSHAHFTSPIPTPPLPIPSGMAAPVHASTSSSHWQASADQGPHWHPYGNADNMTSRSSIPSVRSSTTLVEPTPSLAPSSSDEPNDERPSIELKISRCGAKILNTVVVDSADRPLYFISSDECRTVVLAERDGSRVATIDWDRQSPRMVFRGRKVKCKEWLPRARPNSECVPILIMHASSL